MISRPFLNFPSGSEETPYKSPMVGGVCVTNGYATFQCPPAAGCLSTITKVVDLCVELSIVSTNDRVAVPVG